MRSASRGKKLSRDIKAPRQRALILCSSLGPLRLANWSLNRRTRRHFFRFIGWQRRNRSAVRRDFTTSLYRQILPVKSSDERTVEPRHRNCPLFRGCRACRSGLPIVPLSRIVPAVAVSVLMAGDGAGCSAPPDCSAAVTAGCVSTFGPDAWSADLSPDVVA